MADPSLKQKLKSGKPIVGVLTTLYQDTSHVEMLGLLGYDFLWVEAEHSAASPQNQIDRVPNDIRARLGGVSSTVDRAEPLSVQELVRLWRWQLAARQRERRRAQGVVAR